MLPDVDMLLSDEMFTGPVPLIVPPKRMLPPVPASVLTVTSEPLRFPVISSVPLPVTVKGPMLTTGPVIFAPPLVPVFWMVTTEPLMLPELVMLLSDEILRVLPELTVPPSVMLPLSPAAVLNVMPLPLMVLMELRFPFDCSVTKLLPVIAPPILMKPSLPTLDSEIMLPLRVLLVVILPPEVTWMAPVLVSGPPRVMLPADPALVPRVIDCPSTALLVFSTPAAVMVTAPVPTILLLTLIAPWLSMLIVLPETCPEIFSVLAAPV